MFSTIWLILKKIMFIINMLKKRLFFVHNSKILQIQRKILICAYLPSDLSTETVDSFSLDFGAI
jgi:hypothetical protein